jgi:hypothetical protein
VLRGELEGFAVHDAGAEGYGHVRNVGGAAVALRHEAVVESLSPEVVGPDGQTAWDRAAAVSGVFDVESKGVFAGEVHTRCDVALTGRVDDVYRDVFRVAAFVAGGSIAVNAGTVGVDGKAAIEAWFVDADWVVAVPGCGGPGGDDLLAGFGVVVWFLGVADGGWGFAADEAAGEGAVEFIPAIG